MFDLFLWVSELFTLGLVLAGLWLPSFGTLDQKPQIILTFGSVGFSFFFFFVLIRLIVSPTTYTLQCVRHKNNQKSVEEYIRTIMKIKPRIYLSFKCFSYDEDGYRVISLHGKREFIYDVCLDTSSDLPNFAKKGFEIAKIKFKKRLTFEPEVQRLFNAKIQELKQEIKGEDEEYEISIEVKIPGLYGDDEEEQEGHANKKRRAILPVKGVDSLPFSIHFFWFLISHFLGLQYVYILWLRSKTVKLSYTFEKNIKNRS